MKIFIKSIGFGGVMFLIIYLLSAFVFADLNITHWSENGRALVAFIGGLVLFAGMGAAFQIMDNEKYK